MGTGVVWVLSTSCMQTKVIKVYKAKAIEEHKHTKVQQKGNFNLSVSE